MQSRFTPRSWRRTAVALGIASLAATGLLATQALGAGKATCPKTVKVAFIYPTSTQNFAAEMARGARFAASQFKCVKLTLGAPADATDFATQVRLFNDATRTSPDGVAVMTLAPPNFVRPVRDAIRKGIPIAVVDAQLPPSAGAKLFVGNNNTQAGYDLAKYVLSKIPKSAKGSIVLGSSGPIPVLELRAKGFEKAIKELRPDLEVKGPYNTTFDPNQDFKVWNDLVKANPEALAFIGTGDAALNNLARIKATTKGKFLTAAFDLNAAGVNAVRSGVNTAAMSPEHFLKGYVGVRLLVESALSGKPLPTGWWNPGNLLVNSKNVRSIIARQRTDRTRRAWFAPVVRKQFANPKQYLKPMSQVQ